MLYALVGGRRTLASPGAKGVCPLCGADVRSKCGKVVTWHWAHLGKTGDCDSWSEPETPWHRWWKERAPEAWCEVSMGEHRADILIPGKGVAELQHSPISVEDIQAREKFYQQMIWVLDARIYALGSTLFNMHVERLEPLHGGGWLWRWPKVSFLEAQKSILLDLGTHVLQVKRLERKWGGSGEQVIIHGTQRSRQWVLQTLSLRTVDESERDKVISYIAEWHVERPPREDESAREPAAKQYAVQRREFSDREQVDRWLARGQRDDLSLFEWRGDGSLVELPHARGAVGRVG